MVNDNQTPAPLPWDVREITAGHERVSHLCPNDCYYAHLSIYYFAAALCQGGFVLDAGSGAGYGSAYLTEHGARFVEAIDLSAQGVAFSKYYFQRSNLRFQVMDLQRITGLPERQFDVIFSSNALEHVPDVAAFLASARRLLKPEGAIILAVPPVVDDASRNANLGNPYHLNIWSPRQWHHALNLYFAEIQPYRHSFEKPGVTLDFENTPEQTTIDEKDFLFEPIRLERFHHAHTLTVIFLARKPRADAQAPTPGTPITFVDDSFTRPHQPSLLQRAWAIRREQGLGVLARKSASFLWAQLVRRP